MKQHYLPKFYLNGFTEPCTTPGHHPSLWVYYKKQQKWKRRAPKNLAVVSDLYSAQLETGERFDEIEESLSTIEHKMANILRDKLTRGIPLSLGDRQTTVFFVALMCLRVPSLHKELKHFITGFDSSEFQKFWKHALGRRDEVHYGKGIPEELEEKDIELIRAYLHAHPNLSLMSILIMNARDEAKALGRMSWTFYLSKEPNYFVTSDRPVVWLDPVGASECGWDNKNVEITLPFSSHVALLCRWAEQGDLYIDVSGNKEFVAHANRRQIYFAHDFIVARHQIFPGNEALTDRTFIRPAVTA